MIFLPITPGIMHLARSCSARPASGPQRDFHRFVTGSKSAYLTFKLQWRPSVDLPRLKSLHSLWQPIQQVFLFFQRYHKISPAQRDPSFTSHTSSYTGLVSNPCCWFAGLITPSKPIAAVYLQAVLGWLLHCLHHMLSPSDWLYVCPIVCRGGFAYFRWSRRLKPDAYNKAPDSQFGIVN